ncbi:hypothetical protein KC339_g3651 [Hortaea werneckii]|nr:hypothetical protein KC339_g3651 [Hortaea werneckii]
MAQNWGLRGLNQSFKTQHHAVYPAVDCSQAKLPQPFVVCVVGASRGIGAGIAISYAKAGVTGLVLASRRVSGLEETAAECMKHTPNVRIEIVSCDITSAESVSGLADHVKSAFGRRLDVVAVNSGYSGPVALKLDEADPNAFQQAGNQWAKGFIGVSSLASLIVRGPIASSQYCVSKAAQLKLLEHIHEQYFLEGLKTFAVHPGAVASEMAQESAPKEFLPHLIDDAELCGAICVWLTQSGDQNWLSGRLISANWDVHELNGMRGQIERKDLLKLGLFGPESWTDLDLSPAETMGLPQQQDAQQSPMEAQPHTSDPRSTSQLPPEALNLATRLFDFARQGKTAELQQYVSTGIPVNLTNHKGDTLLMLSAYYGNLDTVNMLLERGADTNVLNERGQSPIAGAVFKGYFEIVKAMHEKGADLRAGQPNAIDSAKMFRREDMLRLFGADEEVAEEVAV